MKLIIVGGGKVAFYMVKELTHRNNKYNRDEKHDIIIIESNEEAAIKVANHLPVHVIHGDGTSVEVLKNVCKDCEMIIALTGKDENNLIACQIAKKLFKVPATMARVNNPRNIPVMETLGVDKVFCGTKVMAELLEQEIDYKGLKIIQSINQSNSVLIEFSLSFKSKACNHTLNDFTFINNSRIVTITTLEGNVVLPVGDTIMRAGELLMMVCSRNDIGLIWEAMVK